ncbi:MAG: type III-B CRISPR module RAMP protein Cmr4 [Bacteroidales bacterium]|nr:type III-B CRISPR module RAMP protein Cmr4 [Bacteroidales bacterium]
MYRKANILLLKTETPLHAGSGDSLGIVDMPIQRERHTSFPKIEASSLKGSLREHFERELLFKIKDDSSKKEEYKENVKKITASFGSDGEGNSENSKAGSLGFTDARLLLFPVKSMKGIFAWITCPQIISKFNEELKLAGHENIYFKISNGNLAATDSNLYLNDENIILEEYTFEVNKKTKEKNEVNKLGKWLSLNLFDGKGYFAEKLMTDIVVLKNDDFKDFVNLSTEVITRTRIDNETGTVADGALFTEEYLPAEALMYSLVLTAPEFAKKVTKKEFETEEKLKTFFKKFISEHEVLQIGGNATLGKGITKAKFVEPNNEGGNK